MPILSVFFGIIVRTWHDDHPPPHIHVEYQGFEALVQIQTGPVSKGKLPRKVATIVQVRYSQLSRPKSYEIKIEAG